MLRMFMKTPSLSLFRYSRSAGFLFVCPTNESFEFTCMSAVEHSGRRVVCTCASFSEGPWFYSCPGGRLCWGHVPLQSVLLFKHKHCTAVSAHLSLPFAPFKTQFSHSFAEPTLSWWKTVLKQTRERFAIYCSRCLSERKLEILRYSLPHISCTTMNVLCANHSHKYWKFFEKPSKR